MRTYTMSKIEYITNEDKKIINRVNTINFDDYSAENIDDMGEYKEHGDWVKPVFPSNIQRTWS